MYINLKGEMAKKGITIEDISKLLGIHRNSAAYKINKEGSLTIEQAEKIQECYFPELSMKYLYSRQERKAV